MIVAKIGGSCLSNKDDIKKVIEIVKKNMENGVKPVLVVSAFKGVTDELLAQAQNALTDSFDLKKIEKLHYEFIEDLSPHMKSRAEGNVKALLEELRKLLLGVSGARALRPSDKDRIVSYGEKMATEIVAAYINDFGFEAKPLWDEDAGIVTNSNFGNGSILGESKDFMREKLDTRYIPVVAGFFGRDKEARIVTLGRGGSDYTATFIAAALNCGVMLFKDVDGLMTADPKIVKNALVIEKINYWDALELAFYGSKVIFEKSLTPAMEAKVPIKITNFYNSDTGTTICDEGEATAISSLSNVIKLNLFSRLKVANKIASLLSELNVFEINPLLLTKASRHDISLFVKESEAEIAQRVIRKMNNINIKVEKGLGLVTAIGSVVREKGIMSISKFLLNKGININAIERSASRRNLCVVVKGENVPLATQALHDFFVGSKF